MFETIKLFTNIAVSIAEVLIFVNFLSEMQKKIYSGVIWNLFCAGMCVIVCVFGTILHGSSYTVLFTIFFYSTVSIVFYKGKPLYKFFSAVLMVLLAIISELLAAFLFVLISGKPIDVQQNDPMFFLLGAFTSKIILIFIFQTIFRIRKTKSENLPLKLWLLLLSIPIGSATIASFIFLDNFARHSANLLPVFIALLLLLFMNIVIFYLFDKLLIISELQIKNLEAVNQIKLQTDQYTRIMENHKNIRNIWHDMKNHFIVITKMLKQSELEKLDNYISNLYLQNSTDSYVINTGNISIDAILEEKFLTLKSKKIELSLQIDIPIINNLENMDMCILLGNLMDNAIEACERITVDDLEKKIWVKIRYEKGFLLINVVNTYPGKSRIVDGQYLTTKSNQNEHGFGLLSINRIVDKYNGNLDIYSEGTQFVVKAALKIEH